MSSFNLLNKITDQRRKDLLFGYIHQFNKNHQHTLSIPEMINYLCLQYYLFYADYFVKYGKSINVKNSEYGYMNIVTSSSNDDYTAYGNYTIDVENETKEDITKYIWDIVYQRNCIYRY